MGLSLEASKRAQYVDITDREVSSNGPKPNGSRAFSNLSFCTARVIVSHRMRWKAQAT